MKTRPLWQVFIPLRKGQEDAVQALCAEVFQTPACAYTAEDSHEASVSVYLPEKPDAAVLAALNQRLRQLPTPTPCPPHAMPALQVKRLTARDWVKAWQRNIRPIRIGQALLIRPSWDKSPPRAGQHLIVLDPGLSFGTGHHPTTRYCLHELVRLSRRGPATFLDLGTGSGLLAMAAAKLGYRLIHALDNDPEAIRVARANARANHVGRQIRFFPADLADYAPAHHQKFDVVAANLTDGLLVEHATRIASSLATPGWLILAGILSERFPAVQKAYEDLDLRLGRRRDQGEWTGATFRAGGPRRSSVRRAGGPSASYFPAGGASSRRLRL